MKKNLFLFLLSIFALPLFSQVTDTGDKVGIGTTTPVTKLHVSDTKRMGIRLGGPSTSSKAVADFEFRPNDDLTVGGARYWTWSFRTDTWSSAIGDYVLFSHNGTNYTSPIIFQTDGDVLLGTGNNAARNGNIGIGTMTPTEKLHVDGNILLGGQPAPRFNNSLSAYVLQSDYLYGHTNTQMIRVGESGNHISIRGNLSVGTETFGTHQLAVEGSIGAREVKVEASGWSDFVFEKDYPIMSLEEVENYIHTNQHLPSIPSEAEVTKNGINLGEMDSKLLQKIEELTLYMIDMNKEIKALKAENEALKEEVKELKK
ncbi:MAG: hypothetical protein AAFO07_07590 [Bacteroidota bacterium]